MNTEAFIKIYNESRNGCNHFVRHPLARNFQYSDGVQKCFEMGLYWLSDILATEVPAIMHVGDTAIIYVTAKSSKANIRAELSDGVVSWSRRIDYTDLPDGELVFYIAHEGERFAMILPNEY